MLEPDDAMHLLLKILETLEMKGNFEGLFYKTQGYLGNSSSRTE